MYKQKLNNQSGFTFIELIIYLAIVGSILTSMVLFSLRILDTRTKTGTIQQVQANTRTAVDFISRQIRSSENINVGASTFNSDPGVLSLQMADSAVNPTVFQLDQDDGTLTVTQGANPTQNITDQNINVTNLVFTNLTGSNPRENVQIEITIEYNNPENSSIYDASETIMTNVTIRK